MGWWMRLQIHCSPLESGLKISLAGLFFLVVSTTISCFSISNIQYSITPIFVVMISLIPQDIVSLCFHKSQHDLLRGFLILLTFLLYPVNAFGHIIGDYHAPVRRDITSAQANSNSTTQPAASSHQNHSSYNENHKYATTSSLDSSKGLSNLEADDVCLLWDNTCTGNRTQVLERFFGGSEIQDTINCIDKNDDSTCTVHNSSNSRLLLSRIRTWMRSPQCVSSSSEYG